MKRQLSTKIFFFSFLILLISFFGGNRSNMMRSYAETTPILDGEVVDPASIIPKPQEIIALSGSPVVVDSEWKIVTTTDNDHEKFTANYLKNKILEITGIEIGVVDISKMPSEKRIIIGNPNKDLTLAGIALSEGIDINLALQHDFDQGYVLLIKPEEILIFAKSETGTFYGMISLTWLLKGSGGALIFPHTKITDWPDMEVRGFYGGGEWMWKDKAVTTKTTEGTEEWIDILAGYKYNLWTGSIWKLSKDPSQSSIDRLFHRERFLKERHFFTSATMPPHSVKSYDKNLFSGISVYDARAVFNSSDVAIMTSLDLPLANPDFEDGTDGFPDGWYQTNQNSGTYWLLDDESYSGESSAKLTLEYDLPGTDSSSILIPGSSWRDRDLLLEPNKIYELSVWAKKNAVIDEPQTQLTCVISRKENGEDVVATESVTFEDNGNIWQNYRNMFSTYNGEYKMYMYSRAQSASELELWIDDITLTDVSHKMVNVIENESSSIEVWNENRTIKYREGIDFDYIIEREGEIDPSDPLNGKKVTIKRIEGRAIPPNAEISLDYDFVPKMQQWRTEYNSQADPLVFKLYDENIVRPTLTWITPDFVFIGVDEIRGINRDSRANKLGLENYQLMAYFLNRIIDIIHSYDENIKVLLWDDMLSPYHNGGDVNYQAYHGGKPGKTYHALDLMRKENVTLISWWYGEDKRNLMMNSPALYNRAGLEFMGGPWSDLENIEKWSYLSYKNNALGMVDHEFYNDPGGVEASANYSWNAVKSYPGGLNNPPVVDVVNDQVVTRGDIVEFTVGAQDEDGDIVSYSCPALPGEGASLIDTDPNDNRVIFRWQTGEEDIGEHLITIETDDGNGGNIPVDVIITVLDPARATFDMNGTGKDAAVIDFGKGKGLRIWNENKTWIKLHDISSESLSGGNILRTPEGEHDLLVDFGPGIGLLAWHHLSKNWTKLHDLSPEKMTSGDINGDGFSEALIDFGPGKGLRAWTGQWEFISAESPELMVTADIDNDDSAEIIMVSRDGGLKIRESNGRVRDLHDLSPDVLTSGDINGDNYDELILQFRGYGIYIYYPRERLWKKLHDVGCEGIYVGQIDADINGKKDIVVDFGEYGIRIWLNDNNWKKLHDNDPDWMIIGDIDGTGQDDVIVAFGKGLGLWVWDNDSSWRKLHNLSP